jgi:hypothetical protein
MIEEKNIHGKQVFIVDKHNEAIIPWAEISSAQDKLPFLITLDHHTDTHEAFLGYAFSVHEMNEAKCKPLRLKLRKNMKKNVITTISQAAKLLRNDEQIDAAIQSNILSHSFSIHYNGTRATLSIEEEKYFETEYIDRFTHKISKPNPPFTYKVPERKIFIVPHECAIGCQRGPHNDDCTIDHANQAIEDIYLENQLQLINQMSTTSGLGSINENTYILDIDLDYFQTKKSINPETTKVFYGLIKNSIAITIAKESSFVESCRLEGEKIDSIYLLELLLYHLKNAMKL